MQNDEILAKLRKWFMDADIVPSNAQMYAQHLLDKKIPSVKKFARIVGDKGILYFDFEDVDFSSDDNFDDVASEIFDAITGVVRTPIKTKLFHNLSSSGRDHDQCEDVQNDVWT